MQWIFKCTAKSQEERRSELSLLFAKKAANSEKYLNWFVQVNDVHKVKTISDKPENIVKPVYSRTGRYSDSLIPFLISLLYTNM